MSAPLDEYANVIEELVLNDFSVEGACLAQSESICGDFSMADDLLAMARRHGIKDEWDKAEELLGRLPS